MLKSENQNKNSLTRKIGKDNEISKINHTIMIQLVIVAVNLTLTVFQVLICISLVKYLYFMEFY